MGYFLFIQNEKLIINLRNLVDKVALGKKIEIPIKEILQQRTIAKEHIDTTIDYLSHDVYIKKRLKQEIQNKATLNNFIWNKNEMDKFPENWDEIMPCEYNQQQLYLYEPIL